LEEGREKGASFHLRRICSWIFSIAKLAQVNINIEMDLIARVCKKGMGLIISEPHFIPANKMVCIHGYTSDFCYYLAVDPE